MEPMHIMMYIAQVDPEVGPESMQLLLLDIALKQILADVTDGVAVVDTGVGVFAVSDEVIDVGEGGGGAEDGGEDEDEAVAVIIE